LNKSLDLEEPDIDKVASSNVVDAAESEVLADMLARHHKPLRATLGAVVLLDKGPLLNVVGNEDFHISRPTVSRKEQHFTQKAESSFTKSDIQLRSQRLVDSLIIFEDVLYHIVGLMDGVPLAVLILMLHLYW